MSEKKAFLKSADSAQFEQVKQILVEALYIPNRSLRQEITQTKLKEKKL